MLFDYRDLREFLQILRVKQNETQGDMAEKLNLSSSFLCQVESGKRPAPGDLYYKIVNTYKLNDSEKESLDRLIFFNRNRKSIHLDIFDEDEIEEILNYIYDGYVWIK